jgi:hypothetical protein
MLLKSFVDLKAFVGVYSVNPRLIKKNHCHSGGSQHPGDPAPSSAPGCRIISGMTYG